MSSAGHTEKGQLVGGKGATTSLPPSHPGGEEFQTESKYECGSPVVKASLKSRRNKFGVCWG